MTDVVIRPLVAGEEELFDSLPDPMPQLRMISYADGLASGGYHPARTWIAQREGQVVARAAWVLPPGATGEPWLERFDVTGPPELGADLLRAAHASLGGPKPYYAAVPGYWRRMPDVLAAAAKPMTAARLAGLVEGPERHRFTWAGPPLPERSGRWTLRPAADGAEIRALVSRVADPEVLTGAETALAVRGTDLAVDPLGWMGEHPENWLVAEHAGTVAGLAGTAGDACFPQLTYLGLLDPAARADLLIEAVRLLSERGAREVVADADAHRVATVSELERTGFRRIRSRIPFTPA
ncbi:hypothetical protein [Actinoplanes sp. N902-109]|uniref:hypothetical protein n=1 Tax=Actinoplanes sp. (strain N902-109) TaxID=649831 RepID=UPI0003296399|nr:hypothetical protein [Actinoplanes sp. N902-109]AGL18531.1 GCN5-related N-acetyltransferase [Actinoplanes sp. N902-109]